jgi:hypothetical protein
VSGGLRHPMGTQTARHWNCSRQSRLTGQPRHVRARLPGRGFFGRGAETCGAGNRFTGGANKMAVTSTQSCEPKWHLREGAIYRDSSENIIRLLSVRGDYCVYAYVALENSRSELHGPVTGLTRRNVFEADFLFVAECLEEWKSSQRKCSAQTFHIPPSLGSIDCGAGVRASRKKVIALPQFSSKQKRLSA